MSERNPDPHPDQKSASSNLNETAKFDLHADQMSERKEPREWTIKGGLALRERPGGPPGNYAIAHCDGPVPEINEHVPVIEKSAYDQAMQELAEARSIISGKTFEYDPSIEKDLAASRAECENLREALSEFDNDDNWLIESEYIDRKTRTGRTDFVYVGKWDPRVFSTHAIKGEFFGLTKPEERRHLTPYYDPDAKVTAIVKERDKLNEELHAERERAKRLVEALEENIHWLHRMSGLQWDNPEYAPNFKNHCERAKQALTEYAAHQSKERGE